MNFLTSFYTPSTSFIYTLKCGAVLTAVCAAYILGYKSGYSPTRVIPSQTYEVEVEKEVIKEVVLEKIVEKQVVKWRRSKEIKPDGTIKETEEVTGSLRKALITKESSHKEKLNVKETKTTQPESPSWAISGGRSLNQVNQLGVSRRMLGDLWLEVELNTTKDIGLNVRYEY